MDWMAESSLARFFRLPTVGMAISIRMAMMAMTMSNSISVKPLAQDRRRALRDVRQRQIMLFMGLRALVERRVDEPSDKMVQRMDAEGKEPKRSTEIVLTWSVVSYLVSYTRGICPSEVAASAIFDGGRQRCSFGSGSYLVAAFTATTADN